MKKRKMNNHTTTFFCSFPVFSFRRYICVCIARSGRVDREFLLSVVTSWNGRSKHALSRQGLGRAIFARKKEKHSTMNILTNINHRHTLSAKHIYLMERYLLYLCTAHLDETRTHKIFYLK